MKISLVISFFIVLGAFTPKVSQIRVDYSSAKGDATKIYKLHEALATVTKDDTKVLVAYKGAVLTVMAKHTRAKKEKKTFFKEGAGLLEFAVAQDSNNIEIRTIRLSVQENAPKFLKYHTGIESDKAFILNNYSTIKDPAIKEFVKSYVLQSKAFSTAEKDSL